MKKVLIVDDERLAIEEVKYLLKKYDNLKIIGEASTYQSAIDAIQNLNPDLIFLDIQLREATAFDILEQIETEAHIIFATAYDEYAVRAFEINALDYLLKPIHPERLELAMNRFFQKLPPANVSIKKYQYDDKIIVNVDKGYKMLDVCDIKAITADGDYSYIHVENEKKYIFIKLLKEWEKLLPTGNFIRIHRSTLINIGHIRHIEKWFSNTCRVYLKGIEKHFDMSQRYTATFKKTYLP